MNAVEIEEAVSELARQPFDAESFPFAFLRAFGRKDVELKRLKANNASDVEGAVLRRDSVHLAVTAPGAAKAALAALRASPKTGANKVKFILATDGEEVLAEECGTGDLRSFPLHELDRHFGFFLPLAGISAVRQIKDNPIDVKAVGRLNKLYLELLRENPEWAKEAKRPELNRLMARLVFCFFAEDTGIFNGNDLFTASIRQFSEDRAGLTNTDQVLAQLFLAMATPTQHDGKPDGCYRRAAGVKAYADTFPFVNGGLFEDAGEVPRFSRAARNYLLHAGELDWKEINPDIFGSMIQAVAEDDERASLGMHYTSVPNILKVLNPLFLDELNEKLAEAGDSVRKLKALRRRLSRIRVFDPACGSGNFLVIAYRQMREIEHEIIKRTGDDPTSVIPLTNFFGIEIKGFAAEIARLALLIAEFQADSRLISQQAARSMVLPLHKSGKIVEGNALRLDWREVCPPTGPVVEEWDFEGPKERLALEENGAVDASGIETYICGNPPYLGGKKQSDAQKSDMEAVAAGDYNSKNLDYICGFFTKAVRFLDDGDRLAFVTTSSVNQGIHVPVYWPSVFEAGIRIIFAYEPFRWSNNATNNAGVYCSILGITSSSRDLPRYLFSEAGRREVDNINAYLVAGPSTIVESLSAPIGGLSRMNTGNQAADGGWLFLTPDEVAEIAKSEPQNMRFFRRVIGTSEFFSGDVRWCLWVDDVLLEEVNCIPELRFRIERVREFRSEAGVVARGLLDTPHQFRYRNIAKAVAMVAPQVSSESRDYIPSALYPPSVIVTHKAHVIFDPIPLDVAIFNSKMHFVWARTMSGRLGNGLSYSSNLSWNTFPMPPRITSQDKANLARCAEDILLAREAHFPATIADLYDPEAMPDDLRRAHERNDETLERIYIGRRFRNDTERLENLFALYTKMTASDGATDKKVASKSARKSRPAEKAA